MSLDNYLDLFLNLDLNLNDCSIGEYRLESAMLMKGTKIVAVPNNHQSFLMGHKPKDIILKNDFRYYDLFKANQRIMCSAPVIMYEQYLSYIKASGNVLLGGLGLGIIPRLLCNKEIVKTITVVELSKEVIELCGFKNFKAKIINGDIFTFLRNEDLNRFNYIFIDAYTADCNAYEEIIIPTRNFLLQNYPTIPFDFWQEDQLKIEYLKNNMKI